MNRMLLWSAPAVISCLAACNTSPTSQPDPPPQAASESGSNIDGKIDRALSESWDAVLDELMRDIKLDSNDPFAWRFLAWHCAYDRPAHLDDPKARYESIRRAVPVLLEGLGRTQRHPAVLFELGILFFNRFGSPDDGRVLQRHFAADSELHATLSQAIDLKSTRGHNGVPSTFLVAEAWFRQMETELERDSSRQVPLDAILAYAYVPKCRIEYARSADADGRFEVSGAAWKAAESAWQDYGLHPFTVPDGGTIRMGDSTEIAGVRAMRSVANYDFWAQLITDEQSDPVRKARTLMFDAERNLLAKDKAARREAKTRIEQALQLWAGLLADREPYEAELWVRDDLEPKIQLYRREFLDGADLPHEFPMRSIVEQWTPRP